MAAMIDIVFLLLIFFMCTTTFARPEEDLPTQLPAQSPAASELDDFDPVVISLDIEGDRVRILCDGQECTDDGQLRERLAARRAIANVPVIIHGGAGVPFGEMVHVLDMCYRLGLNRVAYAPPK
jgi:biopolymer transport protein ExbD